MRFPARGGGKLKPIILYIDDEVGCLNLFQEMFGGEYEVRTATTLSEARRLLAEHPADIIISDQSMPEIKGTDFLIEVAATQPSSYRVLLTGNITVGDAITEIGAGIIHLFITKPWTMENMCKALGRARLRVELHRGVNE
jgi:DNA-binding NtrC family response regulator